MNINQRMDRAERHIHRLFQITGAENEMSQKLDDALAQLGAKEDAVIALVNTDASSISSLQSALDALKASQGDDSAEVAQVQGLIDKLTPVLTPAQPATTTPASTDPNAGTGTSAAQQGGQTP